MCKQEYTNADGYVCVSVCLCLCLCLDRLQGEAQDRAQLRSINDTLSTQVVMSVVKRRRGYRSRPKTGLVSV